ncbi:MAG TPA: phosphatase domain-containing protein [Roseiflexaceae bacterium]|nr:phosphatase domain-containing protein [Roseiflexaceae bacterium]
MTNWRRVVGHIVGDVETAFDELKARLDARFGTEGLQIVPYDSYGTTTTLWLKGRVLECNNIRPSTDRDSIWRNLVNTYRRFESDEVPGARVRITCGTTVQEVITDDEGFFDVSLTLPRPVPDTALWHSVAYELLEPQPAHATGQALIVPENAQLGVISDVDDTVIKTGATSMVQMARTVFLNNARTRLPFPGVAALYQALHQGQAGVINPIFYVSSSPWNLYELLVDFMALQGIPRGPLLLRDWGISQFGFSPTRHREHKLLFTERLLGRFPTLPFLLIGDSGQEDPEIYTELVERYPKRILAIYIRNVKPGGERLAALRQLAETVTAHGSALLVADDTLAMARHAADHGWITAGALDAVAAHKETDEQRPSDLEALLGSDTGES